MVSQQYSRNSSLAVISNDDWPSYFDNPKVSSNSTYGLQTALSLYLDLQDPFELRPTESLMSYWVYIFADTCKPRADNGAYTCFDHCNDPKTMFASLPSLHNCVVAMNLPNITTTDTIGTVDLILSPSVAVPAAIGTVRNSTAAQIATNLATCFLAVCHNTPGCGAVEPFSTSSDKNSTIRNLQRNGQGLLNTNLCPRISARVDSDIGGIGVYLSYWIQSTFALCALFGVLLCKYVLPYLHLLGRLGIKHLQPPDMLRTAQRRLSRLITAVTDFHKTQCFFMLATNIAAIVATKQGGFNPESLQQLYNNYIFLKIIAISGFLPVTFTLFVIHITEMTSWYLISLSCMSVVISIGTLGVLGQFSVTDGDHLILQKQFNAGGPVECASKQPWVWCYQTISQTTSIDGTPLDLDYQAYSILGFCLVVLAAIIASKLGLTKPDRLQNRAHWAHAILTKVNQKLNRKSNTDQSHTVLQLAKRLLLRFWRSVSQRLFQPVARIWNAYPDPPEWKVAASQARTLYQQHVPAAYKRVTKHGGYIVCYFILHYMFYAIFIGLYLSFFIKFMRDLVWFASHDVYNNVWNFGQVVAISIWAPALAEWLHLEFRGMRRGLEYRLLPPYRITRQSTKASSIDVEKGDAVSYRKLSREANEDRQALAEDTIHQHSDHSSSSEAGDRNAIAIAVEDKPESAPHEEAWRLPDPELPSRGISLSQKDTGN